MPAAVGDAFGAAQVLDGDRHAVQLRQHLASADHPLGLAGLRQRELGRDERIRLQARIDALDPAQHLLGQLDRRDLARREQARELADLQIVEVVEGHDRFLPSMRLSAAIPRRLHASRRRSEWERSNEECAMDLGLKGKRAVVTGGSKGIGRAVAEALRRRRRRRLDLRTQRRRGRGDGRAR